MSNEITDKTMVVIAKVGDFWVNQTQAQKIMAIKEKDNTSSVEIDGNLVSCMTIDGILTANKYEDLNYKRRSAWQCKYRYWHERNQQCAHEKYNPKI